MLDERFSRPATPQSTPEEAASAKNASIEGSLTVTIDGKIPHMSTVQYSAQSSSLDELIDEFCAVIQRAFDPLY